jgi:DNA recombination protein RmuC
MSQPLIVLLVVIFVGVALWGVVASIRRFLELRLTATDAEVRRLADSAAAGERGGLDVRFEMATLRQTIERLQDADGERRRREEQTWGALQRLSSVLAGSQRAGRAGENLLGEALSHLPPGMLERDFRVNGRVVEFALVLPDGRRLPIDSKWPAEREVAALADAPDGEARDRVVAAIERVVSRRAREVAAYRDPALTAPFAVAAIPDAAYAVLKRAHAEAYRDGVIVVPYSMALPVALSLHSMTSRLGEVGDVQACLADLATILDSIEATLENKLERASTMLANGAGELRGYVGRGRNTLSRAREGPAPNDHGLGGDRSSPLPADPLEGARPRLVGIPP